MMINMSSKTGIVDEIDVENPFGRSPCFYDEVIWQPVRSGLLMHHHSPIDSSGDRWYKNPVKERRRTSLFDRILFAL